MIVRSTRESRASARGVQRVVQCGSSFWAQAPWLNRARILRKAGDEDYAAQLRADCHVMKAVLTFFGLSFSELLPLINPLGDALVFLGLIGPAPPACIADLPNASRSTRHCF